MVAHVRDNKFLLQIESIKTSESLSKKELLDTSN